MKQIVDKQIKKLYGKKKVFCKENNYNPKDLSSKIQTAQNKLNWLNTFLKPLKLKATIKKS